MKKRLMLILAIVFVLSVSATALAFNFAENGGNDNQAGNTLGIASAGDSGTRNHRLEISFADVQNAAFWREMRDQRYGFNIDLRTDGRNYKCHKGGVFKIDLNFEKEDREKGWFRYNISPEDWNSFLEAYHATSPAPYDISYYASVSFERNWGTRWSADANHYNRSDFYCEPAIKQEGGFYLMKIRVYKVHS